MAKYDNVLYVNGTALPTPSTIIPTRNRLWAQESGRTASGLFVGDIQAEKWRLDITWTALPAATVSTIMSALLSGSFLTVRFYSPLTDALITATMYAGDIPTPVYCYSLANTMYESLSVSLVER